MRIIDANVLVNEFLNVCRTEFEVKNKCMTDENVLHLIQNAPTVELPEQITIKCDTEEDRQKLLSALRNAKLKVLVEEEKPQGKWYHSIERGWHCSECDEVVKDMPTCMRKATYKFCPNCGADMRGDRE